MSGIFYQRAKENQTQGGGAFVIAVPKDAVSHQVAVQNNGGSAGALQIAAKVPDGTVYENIGSPIDMINGPKLFQFEGNFIELEFTPTGFNGTNYDVFLTGRKD